MRVDKISIELIIRNRKWTGAVVQAIKNMYVDRYANNRLHKVLRNGVTYFCYFKNISFTFLIFFIYLNAMSGGGAL
jgi:hypothetical protein